MSDPTYTITLKPLASDVPAILRLRRLLKIALRSCRLRCTDVREVADDKAKVVEVQR